MKVILMHGKNTSPEGKWYPWFKEQLQRHNIEVHMPALPNSSVPILDEWLSVLVKLQPDDDTILVEHSRGGVAILRYLEKLPTGKKVKKVILLGTNSGSAKFMAIPLESNNGFFTNDGYNFKKIKEHCDNFVIFHSEDDPWVSFESGKQNAEGLNAKFITFKDKKHFGINDGTIPGLIEEMVQNN